VIRAIRLFIIADQAIQRAFDEVAQVIGLISSSKVLDGSLVTGVAIVAGTTSYVAHGLDHAPQGYLVVRKRADSRIWDTQDANQGARRTFALNASANVTVDVWFF
jgi:hypothetical protein